MGLKDETITFGSPSKQKQEVLWRGGYRFLLALWAVGLIYLSSTLIGEEEPLQPELDPAASQLQAKRQKTRDAGMVKNGHQLCWKNGTCHCDKGYTGDLCNTAICQQGCVHGECLFPGYCTCFDGFKGRSCEDPICRVPCQHGKCVQPNHCKCESGWFGIDCSMRCVYGTYSYPMQTCTCSEGWGGKDCNQALCEKHGCNRGSCIRPDYCHCHTGWGGQNCSIDILSDQAEEILEGLSIRQRGLRSMVIHKDDRFTSDTWRDIRKWTAHLDAQWKFGRSRFNEMVPENDTLVTHYKKRFRTCAAVGNSGSLKTVLAGAAIDMHDAVLRYNGAPTKPYEQHVGDKTTYRLLNRRVGDALLWQPTPSDRYVASSMHLQKMTCRTALPVLFQFEHFHGPVPLSFCDWDLLRHSEPVAVHRVVYLELKDFPCSPGPGSDR